MCRGRYGVATAAQEHILRAWPFLMPQAIQAKQLILRTFSHSCNRDKFIGYGKEHRLIIKSDNRPDNRPDNRAF